MRIVDVAKNNRLRGTGGLAGSDRLAVAYWATVELGGLPDSFDASTITLAGSARNLVAVTLGNIVGGAGLVGFVYWVIYRKGLGSS